MPSALRRAGFGFLTGALAATLLFLAFSGIFLDVYDKLVRTPADFVMIRGTSHVIDYLRAHRPEVIAKHRLAGWAALGLSCVLAAAVWRATRRAAGPSAARRIARAAALALPAAAALETWAGLHCPWGAVYAEKTFASRSYGLHLHAVALALGATFSVLLFALDRALAAPAPPAPPPPRAAEQPRPVRAWLAGLVPAWGGFWRAAVACFLLEYVLLAATRPTEKSAPAVGPLFLATQLGLAVAYAAVALAWAAAIHLAWRLLWAVLRRAGAAGDGAFAAAGATLLSVLTGGLLVATLFSKYQHLLYHLQMESAAWALSVLAGVVIWTPCADLLRRIAARDGLASRPPALGAAVRMLGETAGRLSLWPVETAARRATGADDPLGRVARRLAPVTLVALSAVVAWLMEFQFNDFYRYFNIALGQWLILLAILITAALPPPASAPSRAAVALRGTSLAALAVVGLWTFTTSDEVRFLSLERTELGTVAANSLRGHLDFDGDGFSAWLAGGDLDDGDPRINPVAGSYPLPPDRLNTDRTGNAGNGLRCVPPDTSVFILSIDAVRWNAVGTYGYSRPTTPVLDAFARECVLFERAYAQSSASFGSLNALFMGRFMTRALLPERIRRRYLGEILAGRGYEIGHAVATESLAFGDIAPIWRGKEYLREGTAQSMPALLARWLDQRPAGKPFLLWVHLAEPHYPWEFHPEVTNFGRGPRDLYDNEVLYADRTAGQLLDLFRTRGLLERTVVVVTSDHGESTGEHGTLYHGMNAYEEAIRVPLMLRVPGIKPGRSPAIACLVDLVPTLEDLLGIPAEAREPVHGLSLASQLADPAVPIGRRRVFSIAGFRDVFAVIEDGRWKLIYNRAMNTFELYDLAADPGERVNLADREPERRDALRRAIYGFLTAGKGDWVDPEPFRSE